MVVRILKILKLTYTCTIIVIPFTIDSNRNIYVVKNEFRLVQHERERKSNLWGAGDRRGCHVWW